MVGLWLSQSSPRNCALIFYSTGHGQIQHQKKSASEWTKRDNRSPFSSSHRNTENIIQARSSACSVDLALLPCVTVSGLLQCKCLPSVLTYALQSGRLGLKSSWRCIWQDHRNRHLISRYTSPRSNHTIMMMNSRIAMAMVNIRYSEPCSRFHVSRFPSIRVCLMSHSPVIRFLNHLGAPNLESFEITHQEGFRASETMGLFPIIRQTAWDSLPY